MDSLTEGQARAIACELLGDPNARLSTATDLRFGTHGSLSVSLLRGVWFDHEENAGGSLFDLAARRRGLSKAQTLAWFRERGVGVDSKPRSSRIDKIYPYRDAAGAVRYEVVRMKPKGFWQRRPDGNSGFIWSLGDEPRVLYRLPELLTTDLNEIVFLVEGEKDVDSLHRVGLIATTNAGGANKWRSEYNETLRDRRIVVIPDNDEPGSRHAEALIQALGPIARVIARLDLPGLPPKGDATDWLEFGGSAEELHSLAEAQLAQAHASTQPLRDVHKAPAPKRGAVEPTPLLRLTFPPISGPLRSGLFHL